MKKILLLGSGELGKEFVIAAMRAGQYVIACDRYDNAPAMQVADEREVFSMLDGDALEAISVRRNEMCHEVIYFRHVHFLNDPARRFLGSGEFSIAGALFP